ncbi:MAG: TonB-dependent receptor [Kofleriaceae bacterium]
MRPVITTITITALCGSAVADVPPTIVADLDAELMGYIAADIAKANARPETIVIEDNERPIDTPSAGVRVVTAKELELTPHKNADDLLRVVPGLYMSQHGSEGKGQQFFLRGFDAVHGSDIAIRVGGIPINEMSNVHGQGYADLGFVIPETVGGLVSRKGPFDLEQGWFATAGSIDLDLELPARGKRVGYEIGSTNRHRLVLVDAPKDGPVAQFVAADVMHDDGYGESRGTEHGSVMAQTEITEGRLRLRPIVVGYWAKFGEPGVIPLDDIASGTFDRDSAPAGDLGGTSRRLLTGIGAHWSKGSDEIVGTTYLGWRGLALDENFTGFLVNEELGDGRRQIHRAVTGGGRLAWRHRVTPWLRTLSGVEVIRDELDQTEERISTTGMVYATERSLAASTTSGGAWAGLEATHLGFTATGGVRVDGLGVDAADRIDPSRSGSGMTSAVSPRIAVGWRGERGALSLSAGRGQRPPEARAFTQRPSRENMDAEVYDGGDPEITTADSLEAGGELHLGRVSAGATTFATWIDRESFFDHLSGLNVLLDGSRRVGVEAFVEARPWEWLALRADATAVDARFAVSNNPVPGAPRLLGSVEARFSRGAWNAGLAGRFLGARPLQNGATAASSTVFDAVGSWTHGRWTLALQIDNLLASDWNEGEYHFASRWDTSMPRTDLPRVHVSPGRPFGGRLGATMQF